MYKTETKDSILYHDVTVLGAGVAENITVTIKRYADLVSLEQLPLITLSGARFAERWDDIKNVSGCRGNAGPSNEELRHGLDYRCLFLEISSSPPPYSSRVHPTNLEGTIAHEIVHLRWFSLTHGPEFDARVLAILRGASFSNHRGRWNKTTEKIIAQARKETHEWLQQELRAFTHQAPVRPR